MDDILTTRIGIFLKKDNPTDQEIIDGATMLLQLDPGRERGIYNSALLRPKALLPWVRADLRKFYQQRMRGFDNNAAKAFNDETVKLVEQTLSTIPEGVAKNEDDAGKATIGKRSDHDSLPDDIKALWDKNAVRWDKMRKLHAQLAVMVAKPDYQACDGNELCYVLRQTDNALRKDYDTYDTYKVDGGEDPHVETPEEKAQRIIKQIQSARTSISRTLKKEQLTDKDIDKLQSAVDILSDNKAEIKTETVERLRAAGVIIPESDGQGTESR